MNDKYPSTIYERHKMSCTLHRRKSRHTQQDYNHLVCYCPQQAASLENLYKPICNTKKTYNRVIAGIKFHCTPCTPCTLW